MSRSSSDKRPDAVTEEVSRAPDGHDAETDADVSHDKYVFTTPCNIPFPICTNSLCLVFIANKITLHLIVCQIVDLLIIIDKSKYAIMSLSRLYEWFTVVSVSSSYMFL